MTKRIYTLLVLLFCVTFAFAQSSLDVPSYDGSTGFQDDEKADMADNYFPPKPKHGTEVGLSLGHHLIHGDVYALPGWGVGLHVRRAISYSVSWRVQAVYGQARGLDDRFASFGNSGIQIERGSYQQMGYSDNDRFYRNYKTTTGWLSGHFVWDMSSMLFHKKSKKWGIYLFGGPSFLYLDGATNITDSDGNAYNDENGNPGMQAYSPSTSNASQFFNRDRIKFIKDNVLDDSYETEIYYANGGREGNAPNGGINYNMVGSNNFIILPGIDMGIGISRKITDRINIALEHQTYWSLNDNLDGYDKSSNIDVPHFTNLKINVNLGKKGEPLYWVNPMADPIERVAKLERDKVELKDSDGDGVLDNFDDEADTPEGCPVDTRGRRLDSDGDGVFDCEDEEPYTPPALASNVNSKGVAPAPEMPEPGLTRDQIIALGKDQNWGASTTVTQVTQGRTGCGEWFLPMIHFDLNKYNLKSEAKAQLHQIAQVMKQCPEICIVAVGHTDKLNSDAYNQTLSYNRARAAVDYLVQVYGISPSRLKVNYGGEATPLVDTSGSSYINRRVEFKVCGGEADMGAPGGSAGSSSSSGFGTSGSAPVKY